MAQCFILPCSSRIQREDRFGLLDSEDEQVPFWHLLTAILRSDSSPIVDIASLIEALDTISVVLRGTSSDVDYGMLREFLAAHLGDEAKSRQFFDQVWPFLVDLALDMPNIFPGDTLPSLLATDDGDSVLEAVLSRRQIACLVIHQFLCSLPGQPWDTESFVDLRPWYSLSSAGHPGAISAYLTALFTYFEQLQKPVCDGKSRPELSVDQWPVIFTIRSISPSSADRILNEQARDTSLSTTTVETIFLDQQHTTTPYLGLPDGACVISANRCFGYGPTGTQEELHVGISPESYPAALLSPRLADNQVLVCRGAEPMVSIKGYGRNAELDEVLPSLNIPRADYLQWRDRTMLFMDALELDVMGAEDTFSIPDIHPPCRARREMILKAYNSFCSPGSPYSHIITGLWGCGSFGGNKHIKCLLQWCAASLAHVPTLKFVFAGSLEQQVFEEEFREFVRRIGKKNVTVRQLFGALLSLKSMEEEVKAKGIFNSIEGSLYRRDI